MYQQLACMVMFNLLEVLFNMKGEWRCVSTIRGEQCVMTPGTTMMLLWCAGSWDMHTLEVSLLLLLLKKNFTSEGKQSSVYGVIISK